jgi:hypothetical protein
MTGIHRPEINSGQQISSHLPPFDTAGSATSRVRLVFWRTAKPFTGAENCGLMESTEQEYAEHRQQIG